MKIKFLIIIPIVLISIIFGLMAYYDYAKLTTPINGIPIEGYCDQFQMTLLFTIMENQYPCMI